MSYTLTKEEKFNPKKFGGNSAGAIITNQILSSWFTEAKNSSVEIQIPEGTWIFPVDFQYDFGNNSITISGVPGKTIITTYDGTPATNFAIPEKIDITKQKPTKAGIYQIDMTGMPYNVSAITNHIHYDFRNITGTLNDYVEISSNGTVSDKTFNEVKDLGYVTELDVTLAAPTKDGLYVVSNHKSWSYGGGQAHLNLKYNDGESGATGNYPTLGNGNVYYLQGTILKLSSGTWSRHYTAAGFASKNNIIVKNIIFNNVQFNLFSPFDISGSADVSSSSEKFLIDNCEFKNCAKVIGSMSYAGINHSTNWWRTLSVYNVNGLLRFKNFVITNSEFSYIHTAIVWGFPPSEQTLIRGNNIHDCYTAVTCFNFFITYYGNTEFFTNRVTQSITNNSFINIRPLGNANWTTTLLRTSGMATISNNQFIDCTPQICYLAGGHSSFSNNVVEKFFDNLTTTTITPIILTKSGNVTNSITSNVVSAAFSTFIAIEGTSSEIISGNSFVGGSKTRYITSETTNITKDRIYNVQSLSQFQTLAGTDAYNTAYDNTIARNNWVYYDKRTKIWKKLTTLPAVFYFYSKSDEAENKEQFVKILGNIIEAETLTHVSAAVSLQFKSVHVANNDVSYCTVLHVGSNASVQEYICAGNSFKCSTLAITSAGALTTQIKSLFFENNKCSRTINAIVNLWAYYELVFKGNVFFEDSTLSSANVYTDFQATNSANDFGIILNGHTTSRIVCENNKFISSHSRYGGIHILSPYDVEVKNNTFNLTTPSYQIATPLYRRIAVFITKTSTINSIVFSGNIIYPESGRTNNLLEFDGSGSTVTALSIDKNVTPVNTSSVTNTVLGSAKVVTNYFKGSNLYEALLDNIGTVTNAPITLK